MTSSLAIDRYAPSPPSAAAPAGAGGISARARSQAPRLTRLIDLAKEKSSDKRRELLREVSDLFLERPEEHSPGEREQFDAVMGQVVRDVEMAVRAKLAESLADVPAAPKGLITLLANDAIDVARPILQRSGVLNDADLISVVRAQSEAHRSAVAARPQVSEAVSEEIIERAEGPAIVSLLKNDGADISRAGMEKAVERAETVQAIHAPLVTRKDLPPDLMNDMFFKVSAALKQTILKANAGLSEEQLEAAFSAAKKSLDGEIRAGERTLSEAERFIEDKADRRELNEALLCDLLKRKEMPRFMAGFARITGLDAKTARRVIYDRSCEAMAIACKAARFDRSTFANFVMATDPGGARSVGATYDLFALYDQVPVEAAQRTLRFWKVRRAAMED